MDETFNKKEIKQRTAVVTGAGRGIGRAIAVRLAEDGFHVVIHYRSNRAEAEETAQLCHEVNPEIQTLLVQGDVAKEEDCQRILDETMQTFSSIEVLVNNAGITRDQLLLRMTPEDFDTVICNNLRSCFLMTKYVTKLMLKKRFGRIVNISSVVGLHGNAGQANYAASKAGIVGLTKSTALEYASRGITANAVAPGFIETRMTEVLPEEVKKQMLQRIPAGHFGTPEDVANVVSFLADAKTGYVNGQVISVDGGMQ